MRIFTEEHKKKLSEAHIGKTPWNKGKKGLQASWRKGAGRWIEGKCKICEKNYKVNYSEQIKDTRKYCSIKCYRISCKGRRKSEATKLRMSVRRKGWICSKETKRNMSISAKKNRKELSERMIKRLQDGYDPNTKYKQGKFYSTKNNKEIHYRSSYELTAYQILEQMSEVVSYETEAFRIDYNWNGSVHSYLPDILVEYFSGKKEIIEVKARWQIKEERTVAKIKAAKKFAKKNKMIFSVWDEGVLLNDHRR